MDLYGRRRVSAITRVTYTHTNPALAHTADGSACSKLARRFQKLLYPDEFKAHSLGRQFVPFQDRHPGYNGTVGVIRDSR
jgi:hypothetical protein